MDNLIKNITNPDYYIEKFNQWEASMVEIDENKSFYMLKAPNSQYEKVCLYTDGYFMCIYGDYGTMTFNQMTWKGNVFNLTYDNISYQMEKLSHESRDALKIYDETYCEEDIYDWLEERLEVIYDLEENEIKNIIKKVKKNLSIYTVDDFCDKNNLADYEDILAFTADALSNTDEHEWISFLRSSNLEDFEESYESNLWNAGKRIHQRYFINMLALKICAEKLQRS